MYNWTNTLESTWKFSNSSVEVKQKDQQWYNAFPFPFFFLSNSLTQNEATSTSRVRIIYFFCPVMSHREKLIAKKDTV